MNNNTTVAASAIAALAGIVVAVAIGVTGATVFTDNDPATARTNEAPKVPGDAVHYGSRDSAGAA